MGCDMWPSETSAVSAELGRSATWPSAQRSSVPDNSSRSNASPSSPDSALGCSVPDLSSSTISHENVDSVLYAQAFSLPLTIISKQLKSLIPTLNAPLKGHVPIENHNFEDPNVHYKEYVACTTMLLRGDFDKSLFEKCSKNLNDLASVKWSMTDKSHATLLKTPDPDYYELLSKLVDTIRYANKYILSVEMAVASAIQKFSVQQDDHNQRLDKTKKEFKDTLARNEFFQQGYASQFSTARSEMLLIQKPSQEIAGKIETIEAEIQVYEMKLPLYNNDLADKVCNKEKLTRDLQSLLAMVTYPRKIIDIERNIACIEEARAEELKKWFPSGDQMVIYNKHLVDFRKHHAELLSTYETTTSDLLTRYGAEIQSQLKITHGSAYCERGFSAKFVQLLTQHLELSIKASEKEIAALSEKQRSLITSLNARLEQHRNALVSLNSSMWEPGMQQQMAYVRQNALQRQQRLFKKKQSDALQKLQKREPHFPSSDILKQAYGDSIVGQARALYYHALFGTLTAITAYIARLNVPIGTSFLCPLKRKIGEQVLHIEEMDKSCGIITK